MNKLPVFISHSGKDSEFCRRFVSALRDAGIDVRWDEHGLGTDVLLLDIQREIQARPIFILVLSQAALTSKWVWQECQIAWQLVMHGPDRSHDIIAVTASRVTEDDLYAQQGRWLFFLQFRRIEWDHAPLPFDVLVRRTVDAIAFQSDRPATAPAGPPDDLALPVLVTPPPETPPPDTGLISLPARLPVYLLLDNSKSMRGDGIAALNQGVRLLYNELASRAAMLAAGWIDVITFAGIATSHRIAPLRQFVPPVLVADEFSSSEGTAMGDALRLLIGELGKEATFASDRARRAWVLVLTDGEPTDEWQSAAMELKYRTGDPRTRIISLACGPHANTEVLKAITADVLRMSEVTPRSIREFFEWASRSIDESAHALVPGAPGSSESTLLLPPSIERID